VKARRYGAESGDIHPRRRAVQDDRPRTLAARSEPGFARRPQPGTIVRSFVDNRRRV